MPRYVALLRGINVGGNTMIKMAELKAVFEECGFENVVTYINSGNVAFDTRKVGESILVKRLEAMIERQFAKQIPVMVRQQSAITELLKSNPFEGQFESHKEMHVLFLKEEMPLEKIEQLLAAAPDGERYAVIGRQLYCHLPMGVIDSLLGKSFLEKKLKLAVTGRNWRTTEKLATL